jgi:ABC-type sulfate/molybdate transport systems ATPase subunit
LAGTGATTNEPPYLFRRFTQNYDANQIAKVYETSRESPKKSVVSFFRSRANRTASRYHRLHGELTVVVIAHRLSTVRKADSIIVLNRGEIVEQGTWQALLSRPDSLFAGMVQAGAQ